MKLKSIILGLLMACCLPFAAQAETTTGDNSPTSQTSISEDFNYNSLSISYEEDTLGALQQFTDEDAEVAQRTRRTRRSRRSSNKYYAGATLGLFIPFDDGADVGFAIPGFTIPNIYGGYKFNEYISADIEIFSYRGGTEIDDLGYFSFGFLANPRFTYAFSDKLYGFASPGIGYGRFNPTGDAADDLDLDGSGGFTFQIKGGIGYPFSKNIDIIGQLRYLNIGTEDENTDGLTIDVGANFKF